MPIVVSVKGPRRVGPWLHEHVGMGDIGIAYPGILLADAPVVFAEAEAVIRSIQGAKERLSLSVTIGNAN